MQIDSAILVGFLFGAGVFLILQTSFIRLLFGFSILTYAANLMVLVMSGAPEGKSAPVVEPGLVAVDPLPQALILTAIVIGFGVTAYLIVLLYRIFLDHGTTDLAELFEKAEEEAEE